VLNILQRYEGNKNGNFKPQHSGSEGSGFTAAGNTGSEGGSWTISAVSIVKLGNFVFTIKFHKFHFGL
jgi:hypothetical protein